MANAALNLTKDLVFEACDKIAKTAQMPTTNKIRQILNGRGSETTIHKYLSQWKKQLLEKYNNQPIGQTVKETNFKEEINELKFYLAQRKDKIEQLTHDFLQSEKDNMALKTAEQSFSKTLDKLKNQLKETENQYHHLKTLFDSIQKERLTAIEAVLKDKNTTIKSLQTEIQQLNKSSLENVRVISHSSHDALMQEKVKTLNLEEKVNALLDKNTHISQELNKYQHKLSPLETAFKKQQAFIQQHLSFEQLQVYERQQTHAFFTEAEQT